MSVPRRSERARVGRRSAAVASRASAEQLPRSTPVREHHRRGLVVAARNGWRATRVARVRAGVAVALLVVLPSLGAPAVSAAEWAPLGARYGTWVMRGWTTRAEDYTDQGLATVTSAKGRVHVLTRGDDSIPRSLAAAGWQHIGDPDAYAGYLLDAYQGAPTSSTKLFVLTTPTGARYQYVHTLRPAEAFNNSFTAIAPGARWFVAGEWGTMRRLLVFAMPSLPPAGPRTRSLPLAAVISLDRPVRDVQGCAFSTTTTLVCSTDDRTDDLFGVPKQLLQVQLARPLDGRPATASVSLLGPVPGVDTCQGNAEVEGIDIHQLRMLVSVVNGCSNTTTVFDFGRRR